jgi:hypothetical protein
LCFWSVVHVSSRRDPKEEANQKFLSCAVENSCTRSLTDSELVLSATVQPSVQSRQNIFCSQ